MRLFAFIAVLLAVILTCDGLKKRKKFDGDFEFVDDTTENSKRDGEKKTWIFDPESELCQALKCRKEERCLLENAYTAVCVSRAELRKNGDIVIPKSEARVILSTTTRSLDDDEDDYSELQNGDDLDSSIDLNETDGNNIDDDLGLEFYDLDDFKSLKSTTSTTTTARSAILKRCTSCPVVKPTYICGTDNNTYSSLCKLEYNNCMHEVNVQVACKGFCPCQSKMDAKKEKQTMLLSRFESKYKATVEKATTLKPKVIFSPDIAKFKAQMFGKKTNKDATGRGLDSHNDKQRQRGYNDVLNERKETTTVDECSDAALSSMGNRLLDWFSVLMTQPTKGKQSLKNKNKAYFPSSCANEVEWMFGNLDSNNDAKLSLQELFDLEHNEREACLKPFLDKCDDNRDIFLSRSEWCRCFAKSDRPCVAMRRRSKPGLLGAYKPSCDVEGFFQPTQCHIATATCWCVDKHGVEQSGSRIRGKPDCERILEKNGLMKNTLDDNEDEDSTSQLDDSDEAEEGSGDY